jgi:hypothetical protein
MIRHDEIEAAQLERRRRENPDDRHGDLCECNICHARDYRIDDSE